MHPRKYSRAINSRGVTLLASVVMTIFLGLMIGVAFREMGMELQEVQSRELSQDAYNTAESGIEHAVYALRQDSNWRTPLSEKVPLTGDLQGTYKVSFGAMTTCQGWPCVLVQSQGVDRSGGNPRTLVAEVIVINPSRFLAFTLSTITLRSGANYTGNLLAGSVDFQVNTSLPSPERNINVTGEVSYMQNLTSNASLTDPSQGITITGSTQPSPGITFTGINQNYYRQLAQKGGHHSTSSRSVSGLINSQTMNAPNGVVFVEGDLNISGTFTESMTFIATGNIYIDGDIANGASTAAQPQLGLLAVKNIVIPASAPDNININAFVLADGGTFSAVKTGSTKGTLNFTGSMAVRGASSGPAIDLNAYATRNYVYDPSFANNTIPFLLGIANVWSLHEIYIPVI